MGHVKITASFPEELAQRLDREARKRDLSRSSMLGEAVEQFFRQLDREEFQSAIREVLSQETNQDRSDEDAWLRFSKRQARAWLEPEEW